MKKTRKHGTEFRLKIIKKYLRGHSVTGLAKKWDVTRSEVKKWIDHYNSGGIRGLLPKPHSHYTKEFKLNVVKTYKDNGLSLRACCMQFNIAAQSTVSSWAKKYERFGLKGLMVQKGKSMRMKKEKLSAEKPQPLTRLEELEKDNLYLRAEVDYLKKLEALTRKKQIQQRKKRS